MVRASKAKLVDPQWGLWLTLLVGMLYATYFVVRYGGLWTENDTSVFSQVARQTIQARNVLFPGQYAHGFGYPAWLASLSLLTGLSVSVVDTVVMPFVGVLLAVLGGYMLYKKVLGSERRAGLSVLLLLASGDFMFTILRGNHEKLNVVFLLVAVYALLRGFDEMSARRTGPFAIWVLLFYLVVFANATVNDYFASTFVAGSAMALGVAALLMRRHNLANEEAASSMSRYALSVGVSWLLVWWVMLFVFPPAGHDFSLLKSAIQKVSQLFLSFHSSSNPYIIAHQQWAGPVVYALTAAYRWILSIVAVVAWLVEAWAIIVRRHPIDFSRLLFLLLFGAFGFLIVLAIPVDFVGLAAGANLEVRNFPYFVLFAAPMVVWGLGRAQEMLKARGRVLSSRARLLYTNLSAVALSVFLVVGLLKSTLDPLISNQWMFYTSSERQTVQWFLQTGKHSNMWTGPDNRLVYLQSMLSSGQRTSNQLGGYTLSTVYRNWMMSPQIRVNSIVQNRPVPNTFAQDRVYDNGGAQVYHVRPATPFQS